MTQARHYTSDSQNPQGDGQDAQKGTTATTTSPSGFTSMFGFQSLSGLFQQPRKARYSQPRRDEQPASIGEPASDDGPRIDPNRSPEPTFVPMGTRPKPEYEARAKGSAFAKDAPTAGEDGATKVSFTPTVAAKPVFASASNAAQNPLPERRQSPRTLRGRRTLPKRRENPFAAMNPLRPTENDLFPQNTKVSNSASTTAEPSWGLNREVQQALDSMIDPGMANTALQGQRSVATSSSGQLSNPTGSSQPKQEATTSSVVQQSSSSSQSPMHASSTSLTHVNSSGKAHMVDVGAKEGTRRVAVAYARVLFSKPEPYRLILENANKKGDVLGVARVAGIMATKRTVDLIPLCHPIPITKVEVDIEVQEPGSTTAFWKRNEHGAVVIQSVVECVGSTGVEMEALTAVSGAALTVYDMCKAVDRDMTISNQRVVYKSGGRSGQHIHRLWADRSGRQFLKERGIDMGHPAGEPDSDWSNGLQTEQDQSDSTPEHQQRARTRYSLARPSQPILRPTRVLSRRVFSRNQKPS